MARKLPPFFLRLRFATSALSTWLLNLGFLGLPLKLFNVPLKSVCSPGFNCHGCPWSTAACPAGVMAFGSAMQRLPLLAIASVLVVGALVGRLVCSFVCPFGFFQDLLHRIPSPKVRLPRFFRYGKYLSLALLVFILPWLLGFELLRGYLVLDKPRPNKADWGQIAVTVTVSNPSTEPVVSPVIDVIYRSLEDKREVFRERKEFPDITVEPGQTLDLPAFEIPNQLASAELVVDSPQSRIAQEPKHQLYFCALCPAGTLTSNIPRLFTPDAQRTVLERMGDNWLRFGILGAFLVLMVVGSRPFCRLMCPLGAIYALTARLSIVRMGIDSSKCVSCGICDKACPLDLNVSKEVGGMECIACGDCMKVCPKSGIKRTFGP